MISDIGKPFKPYFQLTERKMGKITVVLHDSLELEFRKLAVEKFGYKRGNLSSAALEAITSWIKAEKTKIVSD